MPNRLADETSPYLRQHADNPVDWYPWGPEALDAAREQGKPVLLSVGYSACHWCHVMAHESFEDPDIAAVMNRLFINVKVDREERPDIDQIYQTAHQVLTRRSGGWPLTMFLTPAGEPFFGGTYFPSQPRHNLPGFVDLLERVAKAWAGQRPQIERQNAELLSILAGTLPAASAGDEPDPAIADAARVELLGWFDPVNGGLGGAPKFPHPFELDFLLRESARTGDADARHAVLHTLTKMAEGGICDQLGGGFFRYSVDAVWGIPHFEKMLYDNAPLLRLYADAWLVTRDPLFRRVCEHTAAWVMREMQLPSGGYCSSLDADAEGEEGKSYVWSREQIAALLTEDEAVVAWARFGIGEAPNVEQRHWHLRVARDVETIATALDLPPADVETLLEDARAKLLTARARRVQPGRDDKILTSWNAQMIEAMAHAARVFDRPDWLDSAQRALALIRSALWRDERLLATHKDGKSHLNGYLDDYAFLLAALLELLQADFRRDDLDWSVAIADALLRWFEDRADGGFWFTSHDHERLILRTKPGPDNATPSGNAVAALQLQRLGHVLGEPRYLAAAERTLRLFLDGMRSQPGSHASFARALIEHDVAPSVVILSGPARALADWRHRLIGRYAPSNLVIAPGGELVDLPPALARPVSDTVNAWVCRGVVCLAPLDDPEQVLVEIGAVA